mmetsp:Transcript_19315/g.27201  ORF Transcript_19315/g.27201 Transcript_19315/m.27201 type:complete len:182 (+) Transcript_19315:382-927(+)
MCSFLCKHLEHELVQPTVRLTLEELGMVVGAKNMACLRTKDTALTGFRKLLSQQWTRMQITRSPKGGSWDLSALPILDERDRVIGTFSQSDMRGIRAHHLKELLLPVMEYRKLMGAARAQVVVEPTTTLAVAIEKIVGNDVHRAWIVDDGCLVGVVSMTDVISRFSPYDFTFLPYFLRSRL